MTPTREKCRQTKLLERSDAYYGCRHIAVFRVGLVGSRERQYINVLRDHTWSVAGQHTGDKEPTSAMGLLEFAKRYTTANCLIDWYGSLIHA